MHTGRGVERGPHGSEDDFTVHIVDDDDSFRYTLSHVFEGAGLRCAGYGNAREFLHARAEDRPGCVILDVCLPEVNGLQLLEQLSREESPWPVIFVSGYVDIATSVQAMKGGAFNFLVKPVTAERLLTSVRNAERLARGLYSTKREMQLLLERYDGLTERERAVFTRVARGKLNKQVAVEVGACERTIKSERAKLMKKLQLTSLVDLVRAAGLVERKRARSVHS
jgi:FixJ family two-component response regulator